MVGSIIGGIGSYMAGSEKADAAKYAADMQMRMFRKTKKLIEPYTQGGQAALEQFLNALGLNGEDFQRAFYDKFQFDPGFQTSMQNALSEAMKRYSILGNTGGGLANALMRTGQNALNQQYQNRLAQLGGLVNTGQSAVNALGGFGQNAAANAGNMMIQGGQAQAEGILGATQAGVNAANNLGSAAMMFL